MSDRRMPHNRNHFCWARIPQDSGGVLYRLYRRDQRGVVHAVLLNFPSDMERSFIGHQLNIARHQLRDAVDEIDPALMGVV
jgi:hypothetical protein